MTQGALERGMKWLRARKGKRAKSRAQELSKLDGEDCGLEETIIMYDTHVLSILLFTFIIEISRCNFLK